MRMTSEHIAFENLAGLVPEDSMYYEAKEIAYERLKRLSGQDFGYDLEAWSKWVKEDHERRLAETNRRMKAYGVEVDDGMIDTSSEAYKRYEADLHKETDELLRKHGIDRLFKKKGKS